MVRKFVPGFTLQLPCICNRIRLLLLMVVEGRGRGEEGGEEVRRRGGIKEEGGWRMEEKVYSNT